MARPVFNLDLSIHALVEITINCPGSHSQSREAWGSATSFLDRSICLLVVDITTKGPVNPLLHQNNATSPPPCNSCPHSWNLLPPSCQLLHRSMQRRATVENPGRRQILFDQPQMELGLLREACRDWKLPRTSFPDLLQQRDRSETGSRWKSEAAVKDRGWVGQQDPGDIPIKKEKKKTRSRWSSDKKEKKKLKSRWTSSRNFSRVALLLLQSRLPVWCKGNDDDDDYFDDDDDDNGDSNDDNDDDCWACSSWSFIKASLGRLCSDWWKLRL